jgi:uncharacterized protein
MKKTLMLAALAVSFLASSAYALDLHTARSTGLVGELPTGYIKALKPSPEVDALVEEVNAKRRAEYTRISKQNGQSVEVVGALAAPQIAKGIAAGN